MSWHVMDYLPFDYHRYLCEILPAVSQAQTGDLHQVLHLVRSVRSFSLSHDMRNEIPISKRAAEGRGKTKG